MFQVRPLEFLFLSCKPCTSYEKCVVFVDAEEASPLQVWACCPLAVDPHYTYSLARMIVSVKEVMNARPVQTEDNSAELPQAVYDWC